MVNVHTLLMVIMTFLFILFYFIFFCILLFISATHISNEKSSLEELNLLGF